jgi:transposase
MEKSKNNPKLPTGSGEKAEPKVMQRWSAARKREIVLRLLRGESLDMISREIGLEPYRLERWRDKALASMDAGLKERADDDPLQAGLDASGSAS